MRVTPRLLLTGSRARIAAITIAVLLIATVLGYVALRQYRTHAVQGVVTALVAETSTRLRDALAADAGGAPAESARRLDEQADEIDQRLAALHRVRPVPDRALVDAADLYMVTARELVRRTAASLRYREAFAASTGALRALAETADRRSGTWIGRVISAKEQAERDYSDYRRTLDAMVRLLESLAEPRARLARLVDPARLVEEPLRAQAEASAREAAKRAADQLDQARRLAGRP
jgi:hypothetical protein